MSTPIEVLESTLRCPLLANIDYRGIRVVNDGPHGIDERQLRKEWMASVEEDEIPSRYD